ncbi:hypothetical protein [Streptomyces sp. NPDC059994]|uniref:hypothetical protein n=1 Tax=Streptomyces sp. NPDC059994 TaxID=3347029 RepID=UPI0036C894D1
MTPSVVHQKFLYLCAAIGFAVLVSGLAVGVLPEGKPWALSAVVLESLGSAVLFPILVPFSYDRLKEKWPLAWLRFCTCHLYVSLVRVRGVWRSCRS